MSKRQSLSFLCVALLALSTVSLPTACHRGSASSLAAEDAGVSGQDSVAEVPSGTCTTDDLAALEAQMTAVLSTATLTSQTAQASIPAPAFTVLLQRDDGRTYAFNKLDSTPDTSYQSASTSKIVSATIILSLVDRGVLALDDHPQRYIAWPTSGPASEMTLRQLLAFTSGLNNDPPTTQTVGANNYTCIDVPPSLASYVPWNACIAQILAANFDSDGNIIKGSGSEATAPGASFFYSSNHLQVAGWMAVAAVKNAGLTNPTSGAALLTWSDIFTDYQGRTGLYAHSAFDSPSATNPRLAGGMHWIASDYRDFLFALYRNQAPTGMAMLSAATRTELLADQRKDAVVLDSPVLDALEEDWHYSLGNWIECPLLANATQASCLAAGGNWYTYQREQRCCTPLDRHASPGAYGSYPFIDNAHHYVGILATMITEGGFRQGLSIFRQLGDLADRWASACASN
jgi:CubicO group peptidase (beta-lactamase class C family)